MEERRSSQSPLRVEAWRVAALRDAGYAGWLVVAEQDPVKATPRRCARMGFAHLSRLLAELGM